MRHVRSQVDRNTTFFETSVSGALKGPGNGNVGGKGIRGLLPTFFAPPRSQQPDVPLPPHGALSVCWPTFCVRWLLCIPYTHSRLKSYIRMVAGCPQRVPSFSEPSHPIIVRVSRLRRRLAAKAH